MPREELIDGMEISMGGKKWTIPPLTLKQIKQHEAQLKAISTASGTEAVAMADVAVELIHAALSRNYPELTREETEDLLDLGNLVAAINAVMGVSGLLLGKPGRGASSMGDLYGEIATALGYDWDQIDRMTLPAVYDLDEYWRKHPPVHLLVAALMDYKAPPRQTRRPQKPQRPARFADRTPADWSGLEDAPPVEEIMAALGLKKT